MKVFDMLRQTLGRRERFPAFGARMFRVSVVFVFFELVLSEETLAATRAKSGLRPDFLLRVRLAFEAYVIAEMPIHVRYHREDIAAQMTLEPPARTVFSEVMAHQGGERLDLKRANQTLDFPVARMSVDHVSSE